MVKRDKVVEKQWFYSENRAFFLFLISYYYIYMVLNACGGPTINKRIKKDIFIGIGRVLP